MKRRHRHGFEHPVHTVLRRHVVLAAAVEPTAQGGSLARAQVLGEERHAPMAPLAAAEQVGKGDRQHRRLPMPQPLGVPTLGYGLMQHLPETAQGLPRQQTVARGGPFLRPPNGPATAARAGPAGRA